MSHSFYGEEQPSKSLVCRAKRIKMGKIIIERLICKGFGSTSICTKRFFQNQKTKISQEFTSSNWMLLNRLILTRNESLLTSGWEAVYVTNVKILCTVLIKSDFPFQRGMMDYFRRCKMHA